MNTLMKWFSLCLCLGAFMFAAPDSKYNEKLNRISPVKIEAMKDNFHRGPSLDDMPSSRNCGETFVALGLDPNGSYESCWSDGSGYFYLFWEGGCTALDITYSAGTQDLSPYLFTDGFYFNGFDPGVTETFTINFDDGTVGTSTSTSECTSTCGDGFCNGDETFENCPADCVEPPAACFITDCVGTQLDNYAPFYTGYDCLVDTPECPCSDLNGDGQVATYEGDTYCDDGSYQGNEGINIDLNCEAYAFDGGDCDGTGTTGGTTGGGGNECTEGFCPEGTYWDGYSCYECSYCLQTSDDSACGAPYDCCGMCGGSATPGACTACEDEGLVTCWDGSCAATLADCPEQPDVETPGICAEGTLLDPDGLGEQAAVTVTWNVNTVCGDGVCNGDETFENCPEDCAQLTSCEEAGGNQSWVGDGWCDTINNNDTCGYDGGDCCPDDCAENVAAGCPEAGGCYSTTPGDISACGDCTICSDPSSDDCVDFVNNGEIRYTASKLAASIIDGNNPSNRLTSMTITIDCDACLSGQPATADFPVDPLQGTFTVYGLDLLSAANVSAVACDGAACGDTVGPVTVLAGANDGAQECTEGGGGDPCSGTLAGDVTLDGEVNVLDIVQIVNHILESALLTDECAIGAADYTADGEVNVLDIVQIVNIILEGRITGDASSAKLINEGGQMTIDANGYIGGVQMTLSHGSDFSIELTDNALVADFNTMGNTTKLVIVAPETDELFLSSGQYTIDEVIVANSSSEVTVSMPSSIEIVGAYPNPFNPSTTVSVSVDDATNATIMAYDISGRSVDVVFDGTLSAGMTSVTWNASSLPSGAYFLKLSTPDGSASVQKVMLMK